MQLTTLDQKIVEIINGLVIGEQQWPIGNFILVGMSLVLSVLLCGAIGIERERRGRNAGLRTHLLVGMGSTMIMVISIYGFPAGYSRDVARLAAQVVTGVGFLGAGAIIHRNSGTHGLTTAATIWIAMAIGLACGSMNFFLAIMGTVFVMIVLVLFRRIEARIQRNHPVLRMICNGETRLVAPIVEVCTKYECTVENLKSSMLDDGKVEIVFTASNRRKSFDIPEFITELETIPGVVFVQLLNPGKLDA